MGKLLLEAGCDKTAVNKNNLTALDLAVRASGQDELETLLREHNVHGNSHLTNWREAKKAVKKIAAINTIAALAKPPMRETAVSDEPKSPLSPSQRFKKEKAERELTSGDLA